ncbi:MAG: ArsR/SmtB family transcription factor [Dissulfurimicrobium sp.]|uniref:ArsR/SmtB family transcription factor n=1 Tax=Dissulfurimicrobium sp. TaxID=2022436 RepID=UPI00404AFF50
MDKTVLLFKALSQKVRLRILALLAEGGLCVCDLMAVLGLPQSTVSRHLAYLERAGLVAGRRNGVWMYYRLAKVEVSLQKEVMDALCRAVSDFSQCVRDREVLSRYTESKGKVTCG